MKNPHATAKVATGDAVAAHELFLFAINESELYRQRITPVINNLRKKVRKGIYRPDLALKLWRYVADDAAKRYTHGGYGSGPGYGIFTVPIREATARELAEYYDENLRGEGWTGERKNPMKGGAQQAFDVFLHGKEIDTVFYSPGAVVDEDEVRRSLINHDNYDPAIVVRKRRSRRAGRNPIKGPGKFEGELYVTRYAHENYDEDIGDVQELGWYGKFSGKIKGRGPFHIIVRENNDGFVFGTLYDNEPQLNTAWGEVVKAYEEFYEEQGNE